MRKRRILSLLLAVAVMATMLVAVPLTASAAAVNTNASVTTSTPKVKLDYFAEMPHDAFADNTTIKLKKVDYDNKTFLSETAAFDIIAYVDNNTGVAGGTTATKVTSSEMNNTTTGIKTYANAAPNDNAYRNDTKTALTHGLRYVFKPDSDGTFYVYYTKSNSKTIYFANKTTGAVETSVMEASGNDAPYVDDNSANNKGVFEVKKDNEYVVFMNSGTGNACWGFGFVKASEEPYVTINDATLGAEVIRSSITDSETTITAKYGNLGGQKVEWTSNDTGIVEIKSSKDVDGTSSAVIIPKTDEVGKSTTVTAKYPGQADNVSQITVTIKDALADVIVTGDAGATKAVIENFDNDSEKTKTIEWKKNGGAINYTTVLEDVPFGNYKITPEAEEYYAKLKSPAVTSANPVSKEENTSSYEYTLNVDMTVVKKTADKQASIHVNATRNEGQSVEGIDYNLLSGHSITWDFSTTEGKPNEYINYEDSPDSPVYSNSMNPKLYLIADTHSNKSTATYGEKTGGKFNSVSRGDDIQCNDGTLLKIPVRKGSVITITGSVKFTFAESLSSEAFTNSTAKSVLEYSYQGDEDGYVYAVADNGGQSLKKIVVKTPFRFGEKTDTDSGYYMKGSDKVGVVRFFQSFVGDATVKEYGFYFINAEDASIEGSEFNTYKEGPINYEQNAGMFGDLIDIAYDKFAGQTFYAKPYVKDSDNKIVSGNSIKCEVKQEPDLVKAPY